MTLRVLTFLHSFEPGGVERVALRLVRQWREMGVSAPLFVGRESGAMRNDVGRDLDADIPAQPLIPTPWWETIWLIATLPGAIRREQPDILFCAGNTYGIVAFAVKLLLGRHCPPILAKISNDLDRRDQPWLVRIFYRCWLRVLGRTFDHVIGMAEPARAEIRERMGVPDRRISIIPDPALSLEMIETVRSAPSARPSPQEGRRFVAVGRLAPQKNLSLMLRAFRRGAMANDHLTLIGDGPERARLGKLVERLDLSDQVTFKGYVASPLELLVDFDVLLLSSHFEGVPAAILEALAANLSVIATDCSRSMSSLLWDGLLGQLVPVGNEAAFAEAIANVRPGMTRAMLSRVQAQRFTAERSAELYLGALARAAQASCRAAGPAGDMKASELIAAAAD